MLCMVRSSCDHTHTQNEARTHANVLHQNHWPDGPGAQGKQGVNTPHMFTLF